MSTAEIAPIAPPDSSLSLVEQLERDGIATIPGLLTRDQLGEMQAAFEARLRRPRWNDFDGYIRTEPHRHMVLDVLTLAQGFIDAALHPVVKAALRAYIGDRFELVEAKGWLSLPTREDFNGWHGDAWYDQSRVREIPREIKLAIYLTDVTSGAFNYIKGTHGRRPPRAFRADELPDVPRSRIVEATGPAGTAILFDTSGIHRQGVPILQRRHAVFLNYHDSSLPLQAEDVAYYRYHPLLLNAAFLGGLDEEDRRILGFGNKANYIAGFERRPGHERLQRAFRLAHGASLRLDRLRDRVAARMRRALGRDG